MDDILKSYKERLVKIGSRNRSLSCKKLLLKSGFDIQKVDGLNNEDLECWLVNRLKTKFLLIDDPYKESSHEIGVVRNKFNEEKELELGNLEELELSEEELKVKEKEIIDSFNKRILEEETRVNKKLEQKLGYVHNIKVLSKEIKNIKKETGRDELYIGYPFVEGAFKDNTFVRAPLFLFPVLAFLDKRFKQRDGQCYQ